MPQQVQETATITEAAAAEASRSGRMLIQFISPGWGSSGYYSPQVLEAAAADRIIPAGTHMYADHPTAAEALERPGRSVRDLMAVVAEDARLSDDGALVGEVQVVPAWRDLLETVHEHIGVSIRGDATDVIEGEAGGRTGRIIEGLAHVSSVDFVTRAGRGGRILQVLESADANRRALGRGISEATVNDTREALQTVLRDAHAGGKDTWLWVRDFDDSTVWFELEGSGAGDDAGIYGQAYTQNDSGAVALSGDRTEVRVVTTYVPVNPAGRTTEESEEDTMPQIEEARLRQLEEDAGRVTALEERATTAERQLAERDRADRARAIIAEETRVRFSPLEVTGLLANLPVTESGDLDEAAFTATVTEAADQAVEEHARTLEEAGVGRVRGMGAPVTTSSGDDDPTKLREESDQARATAFGRTVKEA